MNGLAVDSLTFEAVDGVAFAAVLERLPNSNSSVVYRADDLGPFFELLYLAASEVVPSPETLGWLSSDAFTPLVRACSGVERCWINQPNTTGVFQVPGCHPSDDRPWMGFCVAAHKSALSAGFSSETAALLVAALGEARSNVFEHSNAPSTGKVIFRASHQRFEFVVTDAGIGVLASLRRNPTLAWLKDDGTALRLALSDGISSLQEAGRGFGFRSLFKGLANLDGYLRFRSGDHALVLEGKTPTLTRAVTAQKVPAKGFLISVSCRLPRHK